MILITGNLGYIGTVLSDFLIDKGHEVCGLDTGYFLGCNLFKTKHKLKRLKLKDIRQVTVRDFEGINSVVHLAALSNDPLGELNPKLTHQINGVASVNVARLAKKAGVERFLFASSCSVYGISNLKSAVDEKCKISPLTAYATAKVYAETGIMKLADSSFHPVILRNATVYGLSPHLRLDLVVNNLTAWGLVTKTVKVLSDGSPWRPLIHVEDLCGVIEEVLRTPKELIHNQIFNVGNNRDNYQVKDLARLISNAIKGSKVEIANATDGDDRSYKVDFSKLTNTLTDYKTKWTISKGASQLLDAFGKYNFSEKNLHSDSFFRLRRINTLRAKKQIDSNLYWVGYENLST